MKLKNASIVLSNIAVGLKPGESVLIPAAMLAIPESAWPTDAPFCPYRVAENWRRRFGSSIGHFPRGRRVCVGSVRSGSTRIPFPAAAVRGLAETLLDCILTPGNDHRDHTSTGSYARNIGADWVWITRKRLDIYGVSEITVRYGRFLNEGTDEPTVSVIADGGSARIPADVARVYSPADEANGRGGCGLDIVG